MQTKTKKLCLPHIGIDVMGSDTDPLAVIQSLLPVLSSLEAKACFTLFGEEKYAFTPTSNINYHVSGPSITMEDDPLTAFRRKKDSSLALGILALCEKKIDAFISMGNTGALLVGARAILKTLPGITHPALIAPIPSEKGVVATLDVGANIEYTSEQLIEFAAMGIAYQKIQGIDEPKVSLLNIGTEEKKGPKELQKAHATLKELSSKHPYPFFLGNLEARDVFTSETDVLVTGGFAGNIFLKTSEGMAQFFLRQFPSINREIAGRLDYNKYPGAALCGVPGIIIKCHGNSGVKALTQSILCSIEWAEKDLPLAIEQEISRFFSSSR